MARPVDLAVLLGQLRGFRCLTLVLLDALYGPGRDFVDDLQSKPTAKHSQARLQFPSRLLGADVDCSLRQDFSGVEIDRHLDDRHAGTGFAMVDSPGNRRRAAIPGEKRSVDVDAPQGRHCQDLLGKNLAVGSNHEQIRLQNSKLGDRFRRIRALWLQDWNTSLEGHGLQASARLASGGSLLADGAVRLSHQANHGMQTGQQSLERRLGKCTGSHHHKAHRWSASVEVVSC